MADVFAHLPGLPSRETIGVLRRRSGTEGSKGDLALFGAVPAIEALGVLEVVVEAVRDVKVVGEEKYSLAVEAAAGISIPGVEDASKKHRRLDAGRKEACTRDRIPSQRKDVLHRF